MLFDRSEVGNIQGQIDRVQERHRQREKQRQQAGSKGASDQSERSRQSEKSEQRSRQSGSDRSDVEGRADQNSSSSPEQTQDYEDRQKQGSQSEQEGSVEGERLGNRDRQGDGPERLSQRDREGAGQEEMAGRFGEKHGAKTMVLVSKESGLFGSSEKAYVLWFGPHATNTEMTQRKAINLAQGGRSDFKAQANRESATDRVGQEQEGRQKSSQRKYVRGESSDSQTEVTVIGEKISKGGLNVLWVHSIEGRHGSRKSEKGGHKGFGNESDRKSQGDQK